LNSSSQAFPESERKLKGSRQGHSDSGMPDSGDLVKRFGITVPESGTKLRSLPDRGGKIDF
jgi:hypothetical protein